MRKYHCDRDCTSLSYHHYHYMAKSTKTKSWPQQNHCVYKNTTNQVTHLVKQGIALICTVVTGYSKCVRTCSSSDFSPALASL